MYKSVLLLALLLLGGFVISQKRTAPIQKPATVECVKPTLANFYLPQQNRKAERYLELQLDKSQINWSANVNAESGGYAGSVKFTVGKLLITESGSIKQGDFVIDLNEITTATLRTDEFLGVEKYPKAYFSVMRITPMNQMNVLTTFDNRQIVQVTGNLTLRGVTHSVVFNASWQEVAGATKVEADLSIDATKWNIPLQQSINIKLNLIFSNGC